jgi:hypothetical protein
MLAKPKGDYMNVRYLPLRLRTEWLHMAMTCWGRVLEFASGEFLLTRLRRGNGGDVIVVRSLIIAGLIYVSLKLYVVTGPGLDITWFGTIFAAAYVALYARFSQQWHYMANLYNSIKTAEVRTAGNDSNESLADRLAQWKAGYVEDADTLHLALKPAISSVICAWGSDERVRHWFETYTTGGRARWDRVLEGARATCAREEKRWPIA